MKRRALLSVIGASCTLFAGCSSLPPTSSNDSTTSYSRTYTETPVERGGSIEAKPVESTNQSLIAVQEVEELPLLYNTILEAADSGERAATGIDGEEMNRIESHLESITEHGGDRMYFSVDDSVVQVTLIHLD